MGARELGDPGEDLRPCYVGTTFRGVYVKQHLLGGGQQDVVSGAVELVEEVKPLVIEAEHLGRYVQVPPAARYAESMPM